MKTDPSWYKDAIIYQAHVKAFFDSANDGIGDFKGLAAKLDYLEELGITALWLMPFYPSPLKDDGYDISDYYNIHPSYGTLNDFQAFLEEAHSRNIRVITELVINHTSDQHPWFQKSRISTPESEWRNFYVWNSSPDKYKDSRIIFKDFENSNWTYDSQANAYYWHRFYSHQPDLNFESPLVQKEILNIVDFWFEMGVDGMRLDAIPYLFEKEGTNCENLPETHEFLKKLRIHIDEKFSDKMLLAEANQWPEDAVTYFGKGDECHMSFHFPLMPRMFMGLQMEDSFPIIDIFEQTPMIPASCQWATFLRNHDELTLEMVTDEERDYMYRVYARDPKARINLGIRRRLAPLLNNNRRKIELLNFLLFSLPGTPIIYYGEEIGMGDNYYLGDRNGVRTPMQWSSDKNAGFSRVNPQQLYLPIIIDPEYHYETINVETQEKNLSSLLWWMRRLIAMRKSISAFSKGSLKFIQTNNPKILSFIREWEDEKILCIINLSRFTQVGLLNLGEYSGYLPEELFGQQKFPIITEKPYVLTMGSYDHFWLRFKSDVKSIQIKNETVDVLGISSLDWRMLFEEYSWKIEKEILPEYIKTCRWFSGKSRSISRLEIVKKLNIEKDGISVIMLFISLFFMENEPETYLLPVACTSGDFAKKINSDFPHASILKFTLNNTECILYDALIDRNFQNFLFTLILDQKSLYFETEGMTLKPSREGEVTPSLNCLPKMLKIEQSNTSVLFGTEYFFKIYRTFSETVNPEQEMLRFFTNKKFPNTPDYKGAIHIEDETRQTRSIWCLLQTFIPNQGDAWSLTLNELQGYFERVLTKKTENPTLPEIPSSLTESGYSNSPAFIQGLIGSVYAERAKLLGIRTAEMHLTLISDNNNRDFAPEEFSLLYQRSIYQSIRGTVRKCLSWVKGHKDGFPLSIQNLTAEVSESEDKILGKLKNILYSKIETVQIRIHGDYHLGQVLYNGKDYVIIDFEGEPAKPVTERRLKRSGLRDIAGMLRSFHYAVYYTLYKSNAFRAEDIPFLEPWGEVWYEFVKCYFMRGYAQQCAGTKLIPKNEEHLSMLLHAFLLDKVCYEINYELNYRPDWAIIPLKGLTYLIKKWN